MAYAQWVHIIIQNKIKDGSIKIQNATVSWGKFYKWDNKDNEISSAEVNKLQSTEPGSDMSVASCGRSDSASGTEGSFDIYEGTTRICNIYWSCPWGTKSNIFTVGDVNDSYIVQNTGANLDSGALGTVTVKVAKLW